MIFISYRREDSAYTADRILDRLKRQYGKNAVFMDVETIRAGKDFRQVINEYLYKSDVLLAVIGKLWIAVKDDSGRRRLDREDDFVRQEIRTALDRKIPVIPLVIDGAQMPSATELPPALQDLAFRNAIKIRPNRDFEPDMDLLIETLRDEWYIRPDSWWSAFTRRRAASRPTADDPATAASAREPSSVATPTPGSSDSGRVGGYVSLDDSLIDRVRRLQGGSAQASGDSSSFNIQARLTKCYVRSGVRITGPFNEDQLRSMRGRGEISPIHEISTDRVHWESAAAIVQVLDRPKTAPGATRQPSGFWSEAEKTPASQVTSPPPQPETAPAGPQWYYVDSSREQVGPVDEQDVIDLLQMKKLSRGTLVCKAGETQWKRVSQQPDLEPYAARGANRMVAIAAAATVILGVTGVFLVVRSAGRRVAPPVAKAPPANSDMSRPGAIQSVTDQQHLEKAVGLVVCGWTLHLKNGELQDQTESTGTCFAVSSQGHLVTNKHVIQDAAKRQRMAKEFVLKDYVCARVRPDAIDAIQKAVEKGTVKAPGGDDESEKLIEAVSEKLAEPLIPKLQAVVQEIEPKVWVFLGSRDALYVAEVIHVSDRHDMAVLKIKASGMPYLRLATPADLPHPPTHVFALGFPGTSREAASKEERALELSKEHRSVTSLFRDQDFMFDLTEGAVSKIFTEDGGGRQWIQHKADINPGNSGGPLVTSDGIAIAVNTQYSKRARDASATLRSLAMPQLLPEIMPLLGEGQERR